MADTGSSHNVIMKIKKMEWVDADGNELVSAELLDAISDDDTWVFTTKAGARFVVSGYETLQRLATELAVAIRHYNVKTKEAKEEYDEAFETFYQRYSNYRNQQGQSLPKGSPFPRTVIN